MDEVPLTFDIPVSHTVEKKGTSTVAIRTTGNEKASFTVVLGCHANGQKLPPMVMRAHITADVKQQVRQMNATLAVIPGGMTKELQPLDIGVNRPFKVRLRAAWERWMTEGEHSFTKGGRQRRATYATICQWIVAAWANVSAGTVVRAFAKAGIISEETHGAESDSDGEESETAMLDFAQLFDSETEDEDCNVVINT